MSQIHQPSEGGTSQTAPSSRIRKKRLPKACIACRQSKVSRHSSTSLDVRSLHLD
ncbi:hypothetical protein QL093DRAFT_2325067 [Fusarium oxysporum]|nr:hypothetical protein QL093DRAFT_2325067 [Fusarium oxysporum]